MQASCLPVRGLSAGRDNARSFCSKVMAMKVSTAGQCAARRAAPGPCAPAAPWLAPSPVRTQWRGQPCRSGDGKTSENAAEAEASKAEQQKRNTSNVALPKTGYFALADTKKEVYSKAGEKFDPSKRGGRYTSDFIWNVDWKKALEREESLQRKRDAYLKAQEEGTTLPTFTEASSTGVPPVTSSGQAGAVSFSRLAALDSMDVDLTEVLIRKKREKEAQEAAAAAARKSSGSGAPAARTVPLPRNDVKKLERSNRAAKQMVVTVTSQKPEDEAARAAEAEASRIKYEQEKVEQRAWTAGLSLLGTVVAYSSYGREVAISYVVGALGGLVYLRLLGCTVDGLGAEGAEAVGGAAAQPRLLIPVILALGYNRWNTMYAEDYGVELNLLAILVGFLTYKIAVIARGSKLVMDDLTAQVKKEQA